MIHDPELTNKLGEFPQTIFEGRVYRATAVGADPTAPSISGGRWAPSSMEEGCFPVFYTSLERDGAIAEVASYLVELRPRPRKSIAVHELKVSTRKTLTLVRADLSALGIDLSRYGERDYEVTQRIGAAINFLEIDGLIAPSARWSGDNLMIFAENHSLNETLENVNSEEVDWQRWAREEGLIEGDSD
jgi:hypothetical protein